MCAHGLRQNVNVDSLRGCILWIGAPWCCVLAISGYTKPKHAVLQAICHGALCWLGTEAESKMLTPFIQQNKQEKARARARTHTHTQMERERESVLVVAHQAVLRALYGYFLGIPLAEVR